MEHRAIRSLLAGCGCLLALGIVSGSAGAAEPFELVPDVSYDLGTPPPNPALNRLDIYAPPRARAGNGAPVVVFVHGGGWRRGDKGNQILDKARLFTRLGYVFVSINYRLSLDPPDSSNPRRLRFPAHPNDVGEALGWLERNVARYGGDRDRFVLIGHSAGAHLVSLVSTRGRFVKAHGVDPASIRATVALDTATLDLTARADPATSNLAPTGLEVLWNAFATPAENASGGAWRGASPLLHADRRDAPHLLVVQDRPQRLEPNQELLERLDLPASSHLLAIDNSHAGINRALGAPDDDTGETAAVTGFIAESLAAETTPKPRLGRRPPRVVKLGRGSRKRRVVFSFSSADPRSRFDCRIDRRRWRTCASAKTYGLGRGKHRFRVRGKNRDGRSEARSYRFRIKRR